MWRALFANLLDAFACAAAAYGPPVPDDGSGGTGQAWPPVAKAPHESAIQDDFG